MSPDVAKKIYSLATSCLKDSAPDYLKKHEHEPEKILDEYVAKIGSGQFIDDLAKDKEIADELGKLLAYCVDLREWPDMLNGHGHIIAASQDKLLEWTLDSVIEAISDPWKVKRGDESRQHS
jgi:hypothetical protein